MTEAIFLLCYPGSKIPIGADWGSHLLTWEQVEQARADNPRLNVGMILGPKSGRIDVECDNGKALEQYNLLFGDIITLSWQSTRSPHNIFLYDQRLADLPSVVELQDIEFRLGNRQSQSICPPSTVDGVERIPIHQCDPLPLPEHVIQALLSLPKNKNIKLDRADLPGLKNKTVRKLLNYCKRHSIEIANIREDPDGTIFIDLVQCIFATPEHQNGGCPAFIINPDGTWNFHCFHPDDAYKTRKDIEDLFGPLDPVILLGPDLDRVVEQYIHVLPNDENIFQRANILVQVTHDASMPKHCLNDNGAAKCSPIPSPLMKVKLTSVAACKKWNEKKQDYVKCPPSDDIVNAILVSGPYADVPVLVNVVSAPSLAR